MLPTTNGATEWELEDEFEGELEDEFEEEYEFEGELESEFEDEGEFEDELELEGGFEFEDEFEGEEFLGKAFRSVGRFVKRNAGTLKRIARVAAPIVGTAVGGPIGGFIGRAASTALREGEFEDEFEYEYEDEFEDEMEDEAVIAAPLTPQQAIAEIMAQRAARTRSAAEAEAMVGAATVATLSAADRAALQRVLPHIVRGTAVLTRVLRKSKKTKPAVRTVPTIVKSTAKTLKKRAAAGKPVTPKTAARVMAKKTQRVLGNPRVCAAAMKRNVRASKAARRTTARRTVMG